MAGISGALAYDPSQLAGLNPGANNSGMPGTTLGPIGTSGTIGNTLSPFTPAPTTGTNMPAYASPYSPSGATSTLAGLGATNQFAQSASANSGTGQFGYVGSDLAKSFQKSGTMPGGLGTAAASFMNSGAGYNPGVAQALIAAMQPQIAKGQANLMEQYGASGQANGSPAALALGDYMSQTNLDVGTLLSGLYEQSVQNYMQVLGMGHVQVQQQSQQGGGILGDIGAFMGSGGGAALLGLIGL